MPAAVPVPPVVDPTPSGDHVMEQIILRLAALNPTDPTLTALLAQWQAVVTKAKNL
jgi:hypothetical protein